MDNSFSKLGFSKNDVELNFYFKVINGDILILIIYVDNFQVIGEDHIISKCKKDLASMFKMKYSKYYIFQILHYLLSLSV